MPKKCLIVDLESVPNEIISLWKPRPNATSDFQPPLFHKVVAAGYALVDNEFRTQEVGVLGLNEMSEEEALRKLVAMIDKDTLVVTWAGRRFDMLVISYRCFKYGIPTPWDKEGNFRNRFRFEGHFDLQDHLMHHGAGDVLRLDQVAALVGLPGKMDTIGAEVAALVSRNRWMEVGTYCITDVIQTLVMFIRYAFMMGLASQEEVNTALKSIVYYHSRRASENADGRYLDEKRTSSLSVEKGIRKVFDNCDWEALSI